MLNSTTSYGIMKTISDLNQEKIQQLLAPIIYLCVLLIIGVPGNLIVLIIYGRKYSKCVYRSIIWNLAVADMTFCTIGIPFNIARVVNYYTFQGNWTCKIFSFLLLLGVVYSTNLLVLLSIHRFRQVCMVMNRQFTSQNIRYWVIICFIVAVIITSPQLFLEEMEHPTFPEYNITGHICPITASEPSTLWIVNNFILLCIYTLCTIILLVIYSLICRKVYLQHKQRNERRSEPMNQSNRRRNFSTKMTKIAFTVSCVFATSYLPLFVLRVAKGGIDEDNLNPVEFSLLRLVERSYVINHVANPFIYAIFDNRFRKHLHDIVVMRYKFRREDSGESS